MTGRRSAIRYEIIESWRISFSVSLAIQTTIEPAREALIADPHPAAGLARNLRETARQVRRRD